MRRMLFWSAAGLVAYTYAAFPLAALLRAARRPRPHLSADVTPSLTMVLAVHNEAACIGAKLENLLSLDYPPELLEAVVASDGSTDETEEIVGHFADRGVRLLSLPRVGKAAALTAAAEAAQGDILVFSDANSIYAPDALRELVRPFADPAVGGVAGDQRYLESDVDDAIAGGEERYWSLDRVLKTAESRGGNTISATGAIYAVRRPLFRPIPPGVTDDFYTSTGVIAQGHRLVFAPDAAAYEPVSRSGNVEWGRKVRVMTRGLRGVLLRRELLDPRRHGFYAVQLLTHKLLRRTMVFPLGVLAATSPLLWRRGRVYRAATLAQAGLYGLGAVGTLLADRPLGRRKVFMLPAFFCFVNAAALRATWNVLRGHMIDRWEPERAGGAEEDGRIELGVLRERLLRLRGDPGTPPAASLVLPVNAQADLDTALRLLADAGAYSGAHGFELVVVVNNYPPERPPAQIDTFAELGAKVLAVPNVRRPGETTAAFSARVPGIRAAASENLLLFDADCRIPNPTRLFDWYVDELERGADVAYTHVGYHELRPRASVKARIFAHHAARWAKRALLRTPTTRGSNYAVRRSAFLRAYEAGLLAEDLNVGPAVKAHGGRVTYSGARDLVVLTSGRRFKGGWWKLARYLRYRLRYNVRMVPVRQRNPLRPPSR